MIRQYGTGELFAFEQLNLYPPLAIKVLAVEPAGPPPITITSVSLGILLTIKKPQRSERKVQVQGIRPRLGQLSGRILNRSNNSCLNKYMQKFPIFGNIWELGCPTAYDKAIDFFAANFPRDDCQTASPN